MAKSIMDIYRELGFIRGQHYHSNPSVPGSTGYTDEAVIELYNHIDQISDKATREYIRTRYEGAKVRKAAAADREKVKREQQERDKRQAEARAAEIQQK